jgi:hypothetical protein
VVGRRADRYFLDGWDGVSVMSKLSEMIKAAQTNERRCVMNPLINFASSATDLPALAPIHYVYSFKAEFGCTATVQYGAKGELDAKLKQIRRQVVEAVFGEFREDIHAINRALMNYDTDKATELVGIMYGKMFDV